MEIPDGVHERYIHGKLAETVTEAKDRIAHDCFPDERAKAFIEVLRPRFVEGTNETGRELPTVEYESASRMHLNIETYTLLERAEYLSGLTGVARENIIRFFVGAGVARAALGCMLLPIVDSGGNQNDMLWEAIYSKDRLLHLIEMEDVVNGTNFVMTIEKLGDNEIDKINALRFSFGASLNAIFDDPAQIDGLMQSFREEFASSQQLRALELRTAMSVFTADSAFKFYDSTANHHLLAAAYPMSQAEIIEVVEAVR